MRLLLIDWNVREHFQVAEEFMNRGHDVVGYIFWEKEILKEEVRKAFPAAFVLDGKTILNRPATSAPGEIRSAPSRHVLEAVHARKGESLMMMDRVGGKSLSALQKDILVSNLTLFWWKTFQSLKPEAVLFPDSPHMLYDYVGYVVAKACNIPTIIQECTYIPDTIFCADTICSPVKLTNEPAKELPSKYKEFVKTSLDNLNSSSSYLIKEDLRLAAQQVSLGYMSNLSKLYGILRNFVLNRYPKTPATRYALIGEVSRFRRLLDDLNNFKIICDARMAYEANCSHQELPEKFIFFPLHFQPEKTTCPLGGAYASQLIALSTLAESLPEGWKIVVKEHPYQFSLRALNHLVRDASYYDKLSKIPHVIFAPMEYEGRSLVVRSSAVAVITGTAGFEGLLAGKKVVAFADPWYSSHEYVHRFVESESLRSYLAQPPRAVDMNSYLEGLCGSLSDGTFSFDMYRGRTQMELSKSVSSLVDAMEACLHL